MSKCGQLIEKSNEVAEHSRRIVKGTVFASFIQPTYVDNIKKLKERINSQYCRLEGDLFNETGEEDLAVIQKKRDEIKQRDEEEQESFRNRVMELTAELGLTSISRTVGASRKITPEEFRHRTTDRLWNKLVKLKLQVHNLEL